MDARVRLRLIMRSTIIVGVLISIALSDASAVRQATSQPSSPKFRSGVDVVLMDVSVLDPERRPVRGLSSSDFTVLEEGKPQPIVSFEELDSPEPDGSLVPWMREVAPDVRSNAADERRILLLILDDGLNSFRQNEAVRAIGRHIVDQLGPADQLSVIFTGNNGRSQEFTNDRAVLRRTVERYVDTTVGGSAPQNTVQTVKRSVQSLLAMPHRRKAMVFVSPLAVNALTDDLLFQLQDALRHAQRANVTIYPINPVGLEVISEGAPTSRGPIGRTLIPSLDPGRHVVSDTARLIAEQTGGFAIIASNAFDKQIRQIFRETASYYLIGFQSAHQDGKFRRIDVRTNREGVTVHTRNGYTAAKNGSMENTKKASESLPLLKALANVLPTPDVPVRVVVAPFAGPAGKPVLAIALGVQQSLSVTAEPTQEQVELLSVAVDAQTYRQRAAYRQTVNLKLRPVTATGDAKYEIISKLDLEPGRYQVRFAAHITRVGKSGSVFHDVEIPDFRKAQVSLSGVVLGVIPSLASAPKNVLADIIPIVPTTQRTFLSGHQPTAFLRIYQGERKALERVTVTTTIMNDQGRLVVRASRTLEAFNFNAARAADHRYDLPINDLATGAYLLRFEAAAGNSTFSRDLRFVVR